MVNKQVVNSKLRKDIQELYRTAYKNGGKYVEESALLQRTIRNLFTYLANAGLANYPTYPKPNDSYTLHQKLGLEDRPICISKSI